MRDSYKEKLLRSFRIEKEMSRLVKAQSSSKEVMVSRNPSSIDLKAVTREPEYSFYVKVPLNLCVL